MKNKSKKKIWSGIIVSDKMDKTIVVKVETVKQHPIYLKRIVRSKKYKVHDQENKHKVGDKVQFVESKPISKDKRWIVI